MCNWIENRIKDTPGFALAFCAPLAGHRLASKNSKIVASNDFVTNVSGFKGHTAQKMKFCIKDFFSKCDQMSKLQAN